MKNRLLLLSTLMLAIIFGIYGQSFAYFANDFIPTVWPIYFLTGFTMLSLILFAVTFIYAGLFYKRQKMTKTSYEIFVGIAFILAFITCSWSVFVTLMWWG